MFSAAFLGATVVGFFGGERFWGGGRVQDPEPLPALQLSFSESAFSPEATAQELVQEGERVIAELLEAYPASASALSVKARKEYVFGNTEQAVRIWEDCLQLEPNFGEALYGLGSIALEQDQYEVAVHLFRRVRLLSATDPRVPVLLAEALLKAGRLEECRDVLESHLRNQSTSAEALVVLGQAYLQLQEYEKARKSFETAARAVPDLRTAQYGLAQAYARLGEKEKAERYMRKFQARARDDLQEESDKAKRFFDSAYARFAIAQVHDDAARVYQQHEDSGRAEEMWRRAIALDRRNTDYWNRLLTFYEQRARYPEALQVARQLVEMHPDEERFWLTVGVLNARLNRPEAALAAVERAVKLNPDNPRCREAYALIKQTP